jgi:signal transduction histidine kinase
VFLISGGLTYEMAPNTWGAASTDTDIAWCSITNSDITGAAIMDFGLRFEPIAREILNEPGIGDTAIRVFVLLWLLNGVIGTLFARIQRESTTAKEALETVVTQRRLLLESEERVRGQVAAYLHDRVQTDLVTIGLRIRAAVSPGPAEMVSEVGEALADLEGVRADKIRAASRQLSPNLEHVTLEESLRDLATTYRPAMAVTVSVNESAARELQLRDQVTRATAIYRICEQGLLNAAIHGHATECAIDVTRTPDDKLVLHLNDDGFGMQGDTVTPGMGMSVISAWVEALDGRWSLEPGSSGMTLTATFPCA